MSYSVHLRKENCDCHLKCTSCDACIHMYTCTCTDHVVHYTVCKLAHLVHLQTQDEEESELISMLTEMQETCEEQEYQQDTTVENSSDIRSE